jgi:hypothetical protein
VVVDGTEISAEESAPDVNTAESSPAEGVEKSMLDAVSAALTPSTEKSPASTETGKEGLSSEAAGTPGESGGDNGDLPELTDDELKRYPPNSQRRIRQLVDKGKDTEATLATVAPKAEKLDRILAHLEKNQISTSEFDNSIEVMRLIKHEPDRAFEVLTPIYQELARRTGRVVPADLVEQARLGHLSEQHAQELSRSRAQAPLAQ